MIIFKKHFYIIGKKPQTDWRRILITAAIITVLVTTYGIIFYHQISSIKNNSNPVALNPSEKNATTTLQTPVNDGHLELNQIIELYLKKKNTFNDMLGKLKNS